MRKIPYLILFIFMGLSYYLMEILFRGYSHYSMFILGGIIGVLIGLINEHQLTWRMSFWLQLLVGIGIVLPLEFFTGVLLHIIIGINPPVWDYSNLPLNLYGQISLVFAPIFLIPISIAIFVDDWYRYWFLGGRYPMYNFRLKN